MAYNRVRCSKTDCFGNKCGALCEILTSAPSYPCPFYKTYKQYVNDQVEAHKHLIDIGREDLIDKYEYNSQRGKQW